MPYVFSNYTQQILCPLSNITPTPHSPHKTRAQNTYFFPFLRLGHNTLFLCLYKYPRADLHVVGMLRFMSDINQPSLPNPFYSVLVSISVFMALSAVFHSIKSPDNSVFLVCSSRVTSALLVLSTIYLFMTVSFSPDIIPSG